MYLQSLIPSVFSKSQVDMNAILPPPHHPPAPARIFALRILSAHTQFKFMKCSLHAQYAVLCPIKKRKKKNTCACLPGIHNAQLMSVFPFSKYWGGQYLPEGVHYPHWCQWDEVCWTCYNIRRGFFPPSSLYIETFQTQPVLRDHLQSRKAIFKQPVSKRFNPRTATILALAEQQRKQGILQNS